MLICSPPTRWNWRRVDVGLRPLLILSQLPLALSLPLGRSVPRIFSEISLVVRMVLLIVHRVLACAYALTQHQPLHHGREESRVAVLACLRGSHERGSPLGSSRSSALSMSCRLGRLSYLCFLRTLFGSTRSGASAPLGILLAALLRASQRSVRVSLRHRHFRDRARRSDDTLIECASKIP